MTLHIWASVVLPASAGSVKLKSRDPKEKPLIEYRLLSVESDRPRLREVMKLARRVVNTEPLAHLIENELAPGPAVMSDADLDAAIDAGVTIYFHATSTAPMGTDSAAVADGEGCVRMDWQEWRREGEV